jgi:SAM-dependent methyltransferase
MNKIDFISHNWLAHKINNTIFCSHREYLTGCVIDLGCGNAQYKEDILHSATEYIGVDWNKSLHKVDRVDVIANLTQQLPFKNGYADTVVSFQVLEHLSEPAFFLSECFRILKPGGYIFLTVPFIWHLHEAPYDYYRFTRFGIEHLLSKTGFDNITIEETTGFWQTFVLKFNYHSNRFARGILRYFWIPIWWLGQTIAPVLDKYDKNDKVTASYSATARKGDDRDNTKINSRHR